MANSTLSTNSLPTPIATHLTAHGFETRQILVSEWLTCKGNECYLLHQRGGMFEVCDRIAGRTEAAIQLEQAIGGVQ